MRYAIFSIFVMLVAAESKPADADGFDVSVHIAKKEWAEAMSLIAEIADEDGERDFLLGVWYSARGNPGYDANRATHHMEAASSKGYMSAKKALIYRYLFTDNPSVMNIKRGHELAEEYYPFMLDAVDTGKDENSDHLVLLGYFYVYGVVVNKDVDIGKKYLNQALSNGNAHARHLLIAIGE